MTFKENLIEMGMTNGLFESQATEIMDNMIEEDLNAPPGVIMGHRWNDDPSGYPEVMVSVLWNTYKRHALVYIEKNCPQHWAKSIFEDSFPATVTQLRSVDDSVVTDVTNRLSLNEITAIANGHKKLTTAGSIGMYEARALLLDHQTKYFQKVFDALKQFDTTSCKGCSSLTPSYRCLKGNNTEAFSCCYHSIKELIEEVSSVKI